MGTDVVPMHLCNFSVWKKGEQAESSVHVHYLLTRTNENSAIILQLRGQAAGHNVISQSNNLSLTALF